MFIAEWDRNSAAGLLWVSAAHVFWARQGSPLPLAQVRGAAWGQPSRAILTTPLPGLLGPAWPHTSLMLLWFLACGVTRCFLPGSLYDPFLS